MNHDVLTLALISVHTKKIVIYYPFAKSMCVQFAEITEVPFPEVYDKFLSVIRIFSFDLSWILSAACLTVDLDFYDELL